MNSILLLTRLQILQSLGALRAAIEKRTSARGAMAGTIVLGMLLFVAIAWFGYSAYGMVGVSEMSKTVYDLLFMTCGGLTFIFSLPTVLSSFFGSSDIDDLLPLPVSPFAIVLSKALSALSTAYLWTLICIAAPLAGWGVAGTMAGALGLRFWVVYVLAVIVTPMMPVSYAGTISIVIAALFKRLRRKDAITTVATVLSLAASLGIFLFFNRMNAGAGMAQALGSISESVGSVVMAFPAYGFAVYALVHPDPLGIGIFVLLSLLAFFVFVCVARVLYMRIVTSLSSGAGRVEAYSGSQTQQQSSILSTLLRTEFRKVTRNSSILLNYVVYPIVICPALYVAIFSTGSMTAVSDGLRKIEDVTTNITGLALCFIMVLIAFSTGRNKLASTSVSREGSNWMYMKYIPVPIHEQILAKVILGYLVNVLVVLVFIGGSGFFLITGGVDALTFMSGGVLALGGTWLMTCVGAWNGSRNPNVGWGDDSDATPETLKGGGSEIRSVMVGLVYALLPLLASPLVRLDPRIFMPVFAVIGVAVAVVLGRMLLSAATRNIESFE